MDWHRFFDADPDPTFHFEADPDPNPTPSFTHVGKSAFLTFFFIRSSAGLHCFIFFCQRQQCENFQFLDSILKFTGTDPDPDG